VAKAPRWNTSQHLDIKQPKSISLIIVEIYLLALMVLKQKIDTAGKITTIANASDTKLMYFGITLDTNGNIYGGAGTRNQITKK